MPITSITRISTDADGSQGNNGISSDPVFSPDGSQVAFRSEAWNLVPGDTNGAGDIFVKNLVTNAITRVSTDAAGAQGNGGGSGFPVFSPDGTKVAFNSSASNLVAGDTRGRDDVFVKTLATGAIERISTDAAGVQGNEASSNAAFSPDGAKVVFASVATNLVPGDTNREYDIFVKNLITNAITRVSTDAAGAQGNGGSAFSVFSPDGTKVAFSSSASNLVPGDTNGARDIFVKNLITNAITRVSTDAAGAQGNYDSYGPVFSPDGTKVAFTSGASNLVPGDTNHWADIFVKNLTTNAITRVSTDAAGVQGNEASYHADFSPDGTTVAFASAASNLVAGDTNGKVDIFVVELTPAIIGTPGPDSLVGTAAADLIDGLAGNDTLLGMDGNDTILGGAGLDQLFGGNGNDSIDAGAGNDVLTGGAGADLLYGNDDDDVFNLSNDGTWGSMAAINRHMVSSAGVPDQRTITGRIASQDALDGGDGNDSVYGSAGNDVLFYTDVNQPAHAAANASARLANIEYFDLGAGDDVLDMTNASGGYPTSFTALGGDGSDALWGGPGDDTLDGGAGDKDFLTGGPGSDRLTGGAGKDIFGFSRNFGSDTVTDFENGQDNIRLKGFGAAYDTYAEVRAAIVQNGADAVLTLPYGVSVTLLNTNVSVFDATDFTIIA